ncbi:hypothetical protein COOONC_00587 [Cooperia oncophora]
MLQTLSTFLILILSQLVMNDQPSSSSTSWANTGLVDPWASPTSTEQQTTSATLYPSGQLDNDPWMPCTRTEVLTGDSSLPGSTRIDVASDQFSAWGKQPEQPLNTVAMSTKSSNGVGSLAVSTTRGAPETFLGENRNLVNLDNLLGLSSTDSACVNPFLLSSATSTAKPFALQQRKSPTLNEMRAAQASVAPPIPPTGPRVEALSHSVEPSQAPNPFATPF